MTPGDRCRVEGSPWPERNGRVGTVMVPDDDGGYPQPGDEERLVLFDGDVDGAVLGWSMVLGLKNLRPA